MIISYLFFLFELSYRYIVMTCVFIQVETEKLLAVGGSWWQWGVLQSCGRTRPEKRVYGLGSYGRSMFLGKSSNGKCTPPDINPQHHLKSKIQKLEATVEQQQMELSDVTSTVNDLRSMIEKWYIFLVGCRFNISSYYLIILIDVLNKIWQHWMIQVILLRIYII